MGLDLRLSERLVLRFSVGSWGGGGGGGLVQIFSKRMVLRFCQGIVLECSEEPAVRFCDYGS